MVLECGSRSTFIIATHQSRTDLAEIKSEIKAASPPSPHSTLHKTLKVHITHYAVHYALRNILLTLHPTADWAESHFTLHTAHWVAHITLHTGEHQPPDSARLSDYTVHTGRQWRLITDYGRELRSSHIKPTEGAWWRALHCWAAHGCNTAPVRNSL